MIDMENYQFYLGLLTGIGGMLFLITVIGLAVVLVIRSIHRQQQPPEEVREILERANRSMPETKDDFIY